MTLNTAAGRFMAEVGDHTGTAHEIEHNLERLIAWIGADTPIAEITDDTVARLVARRRGECRKGKKKLGLVSPSTVNRTITETLRRVLLRARKVWKVHLPDEPNWSEHRLTEPEERVRELGYAEEERLEEVEREDYRPIRLFAQMTGLRRRELILTWPQVDFAEDQIRVIGKGKKRHTIPMTPELHALLWAERGRHATHVFTYLCERSRKCPRSKRAFVKGRRYPITYAGLGTRMKRDIAKAGIKGFRPVHDFRHTAGTRTLRATGNLLLVQKLLNHSNVRTTTKYAHATLDDLREGMAATARDGDARRTKSRRNLQTARG